MVLWFWAITGLGFGFVSFGRVVGWVSGSAPVVERIDGAEQVPLIVDETISKGFDSVNDIEQRVVEDSNSVWHCGIAQHNVCHSTTFYLHQSYTEVKKTWHYHLVHK